MPLNNIILIEVNEQKDNTIKTSKTYDLPLLPAAKQLCQRNFPFNWDSDNFNKEAIVLTKIAEDREANPMSLNSSKSDGSVPQGFVTPPQKISPAKRTPSK